MDYCNTTTGCKGENKRVQEHMHVLLRLFAPLQNIFEMLT